jgi:DMSO/TMAO reductase YedYZ heme-binding membrane subunit
LPQGEIFKMTLSKSKRFNDWPLFYLIFGINSLIVIGYMPTQDLTAPRGLSEMIQLTVRCCVPMLFLSFASSSIAALVSRDAGRWLLRNRRYFGLGFAAGMAWQMVFILWLAAAHPEYYAEEVFTTVPDFIIYRLGPYLFLAAMTITSFHPVRRKMNRVAWSTLHWVGIYYLWYDVELTYWEEITIYHDRQIIDYIYVTLGALAYFSRVGEWVRVRARKLMK